MPFSNCGFDSTIEAQQEERDALICISFYLSLFTSILVDSFLNYTSIQRLTKGNSNPGQFL